MKTLDLVYLASSDIDYEVSNFPDGQQDVRILTPKLELGHYDEEHYWISKPVTIKSRFTSFQDLEKIIAATEALRHLGCGNISLYIPYLLGARSDRRFKEGGTSYLVEVIAPILNAQKYTSVIVMDPHSDVAAACIDNFEEASTSQFGLTKWALSKIYPDLKDLSGFPQNLLLISPDGGALKKIFKVADSLGYPGPVVTCSKLRDWKGKLSRIEVPLLNSQIGKDYLIIDDICDGGRTFIEIGKRLKELSPNSNLYLVVTHGIFSAGYKELSQVFNSIYCTNSYSDVKGQPKYFQGNSNTSLVNQLNVF